MKKLKSEDGGGRPDHADRINELPDALLCSIFSLIPTKQAVAASSVCRGWRYLWKLLTNLDLDEADVANVVFSLQSNFIQSCRIISNTLEKSKEQRSWIEFLMNEKRLEKLVIVTDYGRLDSFHGLFNGTNLRVLELVSPRKLGSCLLSDMDSNRSRSYFDGCPNLETLKLDSLIFNFQGFLGIIENCRNLENLVLINLRLRSPRSSSPKVSLEIQSQRLKHLEIDNCNLQSFRLHCEGLNYLEIKNLDFSGLLEVDCKRLEVFSMVNVKSESSHNIVQCPNLDEFRIDLVSSELRDSLLGLVECVDFSKVRKLQSTFDMEKFSDLVLLRFIFDKWTNLQHISIINNEVHEGEANDENSPHFWEMGDQPKSVLLFDLKVVEFKRFRGSPTEMSLVKHLLKNTVALEKFVIKYDHNISSKDWKSEVLSLPRAPLNESMVFSLF